MYGCETLAKNFVSGQGRTGMKAVWWHRNSLKYVGWAETEEIHKVIFCYIWQDPEVSGVIRSWEEIKENAVM